MLQKKEKISGVRALIVKQIIKLILVSAIITFQSCRKADNSSNTDGKTPIHDESLFNLAKDMEDCPDEMDKSSKLMFDESIADHLHIELIEHGLQSMFALTLPNSFVQPAMAPPGLPPIDVRSPYDPLGTRYRFEDTNQDGRSDKVTMGPDLDGDGKFDGPTITIEDTDHNGKFDRARSGIDTDGDGQIDAKAEGKDTNGNGKLDTFSSDIDTNLDGRMDTHTDGQDTNNDGKVDKRVIKKDTNGSGSYDQQEEQVDTNKDGKFDKRARGNDTNGDGKIDKVRVREDTDHDGYPDKGYDLIDRNHDGRFDEKKCWPYED